MPEIAVGPQAQRKSCWAKTDLLVHTLDADSDGWDTSTAVQRLIQPWVKFCVERVRSVQTTGVALLPSFIPFRCKLGHDDSECK